MATIPLGDKNIGDVIKISESGTPINYTIVQKGQPSSIYEATSFQNSVTVLRQDVLANQVWNNPNNNDYANSQLHAWLNGTFLNTIAQNIRDQIRQVRIPYRDGSGTSMTVSSGASGLQCRVFLPSFNEVGGGSNTYAPTDGATWSQFSGIESTGINARRIANRAGSAAGWWLRSPFTGDSASAWFVLTSGLMSSDGTSFTSFGPRPAFVLPSSLLVSDDGTVITVQPPTMPGAMTVPDPISGGAATTISWGASTDPQSQTITYIVERSLNGSSTWTQVYMGQATSFSDTILFGTATTAAYRVRARNTSLLESDNRTSGTVTVVSTVAPGAPDAPQLPDNVIGGESIVVTWAAAQQNTNPLQSYTLQRSIDSAATWTDVATVASTTLSFSDAITKGWPNVTYRVKATDNTGVDSAWSANSATRTVDNTVAPVITSGTSGDLGLMSADFMWQYTVNQADNEPTTVVERIDGVQLRQYTATLGATNNFDVSGMTFMRLLNGAHTMTVTATAQSGKSETYTVTFTKGVYSCSITLSSALFPTPPTALITKMVMSVVAQIPTDAVYQVLVTNNANDSTPTWEDATSAVRSGINYLFTNTTVANGDAFNFKIMASRGLSNAGGFIASIGGAFE